MRDISRNLASALLIGALVSATALPALAQQKPKNLIEQIQAGATQDFVLSRCAGYFKAMMMTSRNADPRLLARAEDTIVWIFQQVLAMRSNGAEGDAAAVNALSLTIAEEIDDNAKFYLDQIVANIAETGLPSDELIAVDQNTCVTLASQRPDAG